PHDPDGRDPRMTRTTRRALGALLALGLLASACGDDDGGDDASPTTEAPAGDDGGGDGGEAAFTTLRVPDDHDTIQAAVDAAAPGDLVLSEPGTHAAAVRAAAGGLS